MRSIKIIALLILLTTTVACSSHKKIIAPTQSVSFEWLTARVSIDAEGNGQSFDNLSGQLRMRRDSLVWLSVSTTMGMEAMRLKVSTDSLWIVNRMDKTFLAEPLDTVASWTGMPVSLPWVQTLLLDNNEGLPPVENKMVSLKAFAFGQWSAKLRYSNVKTDIPTMFPIKTTGKMERIRIHTQNER